MQFKSIKTKLLLFFGVLLLFTCIGFGVIANRKSTAALSDSINESLQQLAREAVKVVESETKARLDTMEALAETEIIKSDVFTMDEKLELLKCEVSRSGHLSMGIADLEGNVVLTDGTTANVSDRDYFKMAISGQKEVSDPIVSKVTNSVILVYAVPIKIDNKIKGVLMATRDGNALSDITNNIKFGKSGQAYMINNTGTVIAHSDRNLVMEMYNAIEDFKENPELESLIQLEKQMIEGKEGVGQYTFKGMTKYMSFAPVPGTRWSIAITAPKSEVMEKISELTVVMICISIAFLIISIVITILIAESISKPIKLASNYLNIVSTGDFTGEIPKKLLKMKDESGILANAISAMQQSISNIIKEVVDESTNVSEMLININAKMEQLNKNIEEISATTEELSAGIEETSASTQEMNATSEEIESAIEGIASKAQEAAIAVSNVTGMSEEMKQKAIISKETALEIYEKAKNDLQKAIEKSKAVAKINELSEAILEITSQTNLLALNAAIEAARAGEAGKGFAVVAEEIRKLAEGSKNTVSSIQEMTMLIFEAVNDLSSSSGEIMNFIDEKVINDYNYLVSSSEKYSESSVTINDMINEFSATSEELLASMHNMVKAINEISASSSEEAQGASNIAQDATEIAQMANEVINAAGLAKGKSELLIGVVSKFKI
ncbi:methyl-accepting chemotaxis sensory transducer with Cache sensor [Lutispora thermophila DSM 19022]|uniref:Methyl-accepting chemotaxis sensory transducer with Cache sensor n=1 Tax=Lutispora thermophila DSM 19022 TaxID=1122184 RepID=A0A1M6EFE4_9FIRM|nr:methyl-accepting chemotaxis sensory transducer with Cache sensor [Lutispora thermophila DSM 19022]